MSIKKSLRLSMVLMAALPMILLTVFIFIISQKKYLDLAKNSAQILATDYANGFESELNAQIAEIEGLSHANSIQGLALEYYNGVASGNGSSYYLSAKQLLSDTSTYTGRHISYYVYDVNGYFIIGSDETDNASDWEEYMTTSIKDITSTKILISSNINMNYGSIDLISPIIVKERVIGLIRANVSSSYFGNFLPATEESFIIDGEGNYLFSAKGFPADSAQSEELLSLLGKSTNSGYIQAGSNHVDEIYGYARITRYNWIYVIHQDGTQYKQVLRALPQTLAISLAAILIVAFIFGGLFASRFTAPIISLKENMAEARDGKLEQRSDLNIENELGDLSNMFNDMMDIIEGNYKQLDESKRSIEAQQRELQDNYKKIEKLAYHDTLTGLYNRLAFMEFSYNRFHEENSPFEHHAIFFIDLDNFKNVNDTLGHDYGDLLLIDVANQLTSCISDTDILARTGGDEFLLMKSDYKDSDDLAVFADELVNIVRHPFDLNGETANVSMSVGIAMFPQDGLTLNELIKNADIAMYNAKTSGKNSFRFFNTDMQDTIVRKNSVSDALSTVIGNQEIYLLYQPQVNSRTGEVTGFESLMRINSDEHGFLSPDEFIPIAEENGTIKELSQWSLEEACSFNQQLINEGIGPLKVSVNISAAQLLDDDLVSVIRSIPKRTGMKLKYLEIEIKEALLEENFELSLDLINRIRGLGASIAIDNFGTGYSSFNYLTKIPIDTLKIDRSFIEGINENERNQLVAKSIIDLAHQMNIHVVAEGIEDVSQLSVLQAQFCDTLQGYLFSKPISADAFSELLKKRASLKR